MWNRKGSVFSDRYHDTVLRTPRQVRNALIYVLQNGRKHGARYARADPYSSGPWFRGWLRPVLRPLRLPPRPPTAEAATWLLTQGWVRGGRIAWFEGPAG